MGIWCTLPAVESLSKVAARWSGRYEYLVYIACSGVPLQSNKILELKTWVSGVHYLQWNPSPK